MADTQREPRQILDSGALHHHAVEVFAEAYAEARKQASAESGEVEGSRPTVENNRVPDDITRGRAL